ncbi:MAG: ankyrin repeat domain-containing protein, partial [Rickettsiales bacterium]
MTTLDEMIKKYGIDLKTQYGGNLLHLFAQHNAAELLNELIDKGLDKNAKDEQGHTPLHIAAISNSVEAINALIDKGADKEALDEYKRSPLYLASSEYYKPHSLTNKEIDIEFKGVSGYTPLALSRYTPTAAIKALLDKGADGSHAIYYVVDNGKYSVITIFIKAGIIPSNSAKNYIQHEEYFGIKNLMLIINEAFRQNDYKSLVNIYKNNHYSTTLLSSDVGKLFYNNYYNVAAFNSDKTIKLNKEIERGIESVKANILNDFIKSIFDDAEIKLINAFFVKKLPIQRVFQNQELFNIISRFLPLSQQYDLTNPHNQEPLNKEFSESKKASFYKTLSLTSIQTNQKSALEAIFEEKNVQKLNVDL